MFNLSKNRQKVIKNYDFANKIFSSYSNDVDDTYATIVVFMKDGKYYKFTNTHDEGCIFRSASGTWKRNDDGNLYVKYDNAIYYDGGELVKTDEPNYFNIRRIDYKLVKKNYPFDTTLKFIINQDINNNIYKNYITIDDNTHFPIYEFKTEEDLYKKLEEMYGEVYTLLVDDNIEATDYTTENM